MRGGVVKIGVTGTGPAARDMRQALSPLGIAPADDDEIAALRDMAAERIGPEIASVAAFRRVHRAAGGAALFVLRRRASLAGGFGVVLLSAGGRAAVEAGRFDGGDPAAGHLAAPGRRPRAAYGWGIVAADGDAGRVLVAGAEALCSQVFPDIPWFSRAATPAGERMMASRLGYLPAPAGGPGLYWRPPAAAGAAA